MKPDALLFDLDGTMVDGAAAIQDAFAHAVAARGHEPVDPARVSARIGLPLRLMFRDLLPVDDRESAMLVRLYRERFESHGGPLLRPAPGLMEALDAFRVPMAVVTTKAVEPARFVLRTLEIEDRFATVVGVDTVRRPKPDPESVRVALARMGVGALRSVFVGDTVMDVLAGKAAQVKTIAVTSGHGDVDELRAAAPEAMIPDLRALPETIRRL